MSDPIRKTMIIRGKRTSAKLEVEFWDALQHAAKNRGMKISAVVNRIVGDRPGNVSSMLRVWCLQKARAQAEKPANGMSG